MGKISRSEKRSVKAVFMYGLTADRAFQGAFLQLRNLLTISIILFMANQQFVKSQISNVLVFDSMVVGYCQGKADKLSKLTGFLTSGVEAELKGKLKGVDSVRVEEPRVKFKKIGKEEIERKIEVDFLVNMETGDMDALKYCDTLDRKTLRKVRATKYPELKGEHPGVMHRFVWPTVGLVGGVATIVSLFYIRSR